MSSVFDTSGPLLQGVFAIEASAGTGKTYSLTSVVARHVAERALRPDQLLMVTFTRAATAEMRDRTRDVCRALLGVLEADSDRRDSLGAEPWMLDTLSDDEGENELRAANLRSFLSAFDEATITTIHGFCQQILNRAGLSSPALGNATLAGDSSEAIGQVVADVLIGPLADDPDFLGDADSDEEKKLSSVIEVLKKTVRAVMGNPSTVRIPESDAADVSADLLALPPSERWAAVVDKVVRTVHERRRASGTFGYDDLIHSVVEMLLGGEGERIARALRDQYRLVLIDEFQDTDVGQWTIFDTAFIGPLDDPRAESESAISLGIVGDPKQAIYRFRGADIDAYRGAIASIDQKVELLTNFRSNAKLIDAVNELFDAVTFGDPSIAYRQVASRPSPEDEGLVGHVPLDIRVVPYSTEAGSSPKKSGLRKAERTQLELGTLDKWNMNTDLALEIVYADMAESIANLIESGAIIDSKGSRNDIRPGDIAVLVRSHSHAERIRNLFATAGIPAVRYRARSVFESPAALEWRVFLSALAAPSRTDRVRAAALSVFGRSTIDSVASDGAGNADFDLWQRTCAEWSSDVVRVGLPNLYFRLRSDSRFMNRVMGEVEGERLLTDLDHIAEVLAVSPALAHGAGPSDCLQVLEQFIVDADEEDEFQRRIETDAESVHIATIHHSKGLEFPVVFLPTAMKMIPGDEKPFIFSSNGRRVIDLATPVEWMWDDEEFATRDDRKNAAAADITGDLMRMLYVAVTRAQHKVVLYWTPLKSAANSSLGRLLFAPRIDGMLQIDAASGVPEKGDVPTSNAAMKTALEAFAARSEHIQVTEVVSRRVRKRRVAGSASKTGSVSVAAFTRAEPVRRPGWGKWSYSGVANTLGAIQSAMAEPFIPGADEGRDRITHQPSSNSAGGVLFPDSLSGAVFGSRVHEIFESIDPSSVDLDEMIAREVDLRFSLRSEPTTAASLTGAIAAACRTPLGPVFGGASLSEMSARDRLAEMVFDMRIPDTPVPVSKVGELLVEHLEAGDPFVDYGRSLIQSASRIRMAGYLYGEVDAVFRVRRADGTWNALISDYKTNLLHDSSSRDPLDAYRRENLSRVMAEDHYVLQAIFYQVALHRYLRWRVPGYRPESHLGGIAYLFVRGLIGPDAPVDESGHPSGVFAWRPPLALIEALDREFTQ